MSKDAALLIIDDDRHFVRAVEDFFCDTGLRVYGAFSLQEGLEHLTHHNPDLVLLDQNLPDGEGHKIIPDILRLVEKAQIILCTAYPDVTVAVDSMKLGAFDYISKPVDLDELEIMLHKALKVKDLERLAQVQSYHGNRDRKKTTIIGLDGGISHLKSHIQAAIDSEATVLITGESGTGKSAIAKYIHYSGPRANDPIISINCSALSPMLIESELFGYAKGAFTGAIQKRRGLFELAHKGTIFLDEIGTMPLELQTKLLGVLEDGQVRRVGDEQFRPVDVRIIAATNAEMEEEVAAQRFRSDLFYRLNVIRIHMPPLRDRKGDLSDLILLLLKSLGHTNLRLPDEKELRKLRKYPWPGNIRELRNILERSILMQHDGFLTPSEFLPHIADSGELPILQPPPPANVTELSEVVSLDEFTNQYIFSVLEIMGGNISQTARLLKMSESTLRRKLRKLGYSS